MAAELTYETAGLTSQLRVNPELVMTWVGDRVRLHLPSEHRRVLAGARVVHLIAAFADESGSEWAALLHAYDHGQLLRHVESLCANRFLIARDAPAGALVDGILAEWEPWEESSWFLHLRSRDARYETTAEGKRSLAEGVGSVAPPPMFKCLCSNRNYFELPPPQELAGGCFSDVFLRRRTCRNFSEEPLKPSELANALFYTGGIVFTHSTKLFGIVAKKCSPSPGARHTIELYPVIRSCTDVAPGIYHYCSGHHRLCPLDSREPTSFLRDALYDQEYFASAAATVLFTSAIPRIMWKYKSPRTYRLIHFETGHYAQNFLLAGTAMDLGVFVTGAVAESKVEQRLQIDGVREVAMYATGLGHEAPGGPYRRTGVEIAGTLSFREKVRLPGQDSDPQPLGSRR